MCNVAETSCRPAGICVVPRAGQGIDAIVVNQSRRSLDVACAAADRIGTSTVIGKVGVPDTTPVI